MHKEYSSLFLGFCLLLASLVMSRWAKAEPTKRSQIKFVVAKEAKGGVRLLIKGQGLKFKLKSEQGKAVIIFPATDILFPYEQIIVNLSPIQRIDIEKEQTEVRFVVLMTEKFKVLPSSDSNASQVKIFFPALGKEAAKENKNEGKAEGFNVAVQQAEASVNVVIRAKETLNFETSKLTFPDRFMIKVKGKIIAESKEYPINRSPVKKITVLPLPNLNLTQVTVRLTKKIEPKITPSDEGKQIMVSFTTEKKISVAEKTPEKKPSEEEKKKPIETKPQPSKEALAAIQLEPKTTQKEFSLTVTSPQPISYKQKYDSISQRLLFNFSQVALSAPLSLSIKRDPLRSVSALGLPSLNLVQVKFQLTKKIEPKVTMSSDSKKLTILFAIAPQKVEAKTKPKLVIGKKPAKKDIPPTIIPEPTAVPTATYAQIKDIRVQKLPQRVVLRVQGDRVLAYKAKQLLSPSKILIEIFQSKLPFAKKDISIQKGAVKRVRVYQYQTSPLPIVRMVIDTAKQVSYEVSQEENGKKLVISVAAPPMPKGQKVVTTLPSKKTSASKSSYKSPIPLPSIYPQPGKKRVVNMEFKDATVEDMLRTLAEMAGLNVFIVEQDTDTVNAVTQKEITMHLVDIPVQQALDMIISTSNLAYRIIGNTLILASDFDTVNRVGSTMLTGDFKVETFSIPGYTRDEFTTILKKTVPEVEVVETVDDRPLDQITLIGPENSLKRVRNLIASLKPQPQVLVETFDLGSLDPTNVETALKAGVPGAKVISTRTGPNRIVVSGSKYTLQHVKSFLGSMNLQPVIQYSTVNITETDPDDLKKLVQKVLPGVEIVHVVKGFASTSVTLAGTEDDLAKAKDLIDSMEGGSDKKSMAKSVAVIPLKHLDTISALQETEDFKIEDMVKSAVPGIETSGGSVTLDTRNNALIVKGTPSDIERAKKFISKVDISQPQVLIETQVLEITSDALKSLGSNFKVKAETPSENIKESHPPSFDASISGKTAGQVGFIFNAFRAKVDMTINALISSGKARSLASPKVATISGKKAKISLVTTFVYPEISSETTLEGTTVRTTSRTFKSQDVGITLEITPRVNSDKTITLNLHPKVEIPLQGKPDEPVQTNKREVETLIRLPDGGAVVIGGLISTEESESIQKIPFLADIPIIGKLFQSKSKSAKDREVVIIVTAHILKK